MISLALALAMQTVDLSSCLLPNTSCKPWEIVQAERAARANPFDQFEPKPVRLGPGPHTLVISDGNQITRMDYKSGTLCQRARDTIKAQFGTAQRTAGGGIFIPSSVKAFCVPR